MRNFALAQTKGIKKLRSLKTLKNLSAKDIRQYYTRLQKTEVVFFKIISNRDSTEIARMLRPIIEKREARRQAGGFVHSFVSSEANYYFGPSAFVFENYSNLKNVFCYWLIPYGSIDETNYISPMISMTLGRSGAQGLLYKYFRKELGLVYGNCLQLSIIKKYQVSRNLCRPPVTEQRRTDCKNVRLHPRASR